MHTIKHKTSLYYFLSDNGGSSGATLPRHGSTPWKTKYLGHVPRSGPEIEDGRNKV